MPLVVCVIKLVVPVGAIVKQAMLRLPWATILLYSCSSASFNRRIKGLVASRLASNTSKAPRSIAISTEER